MADQSESLQQQVSEAFSQQQKLSIQGGNSKAFYAGERIGKTLSLQEHTGIIDYEPTELVITARAGTLLSTIKNTLAEQQQQLRFDPPCYSQHSTLGGTVAGNFSGPGRVSGGAVRDSLLGTRILNGKGEELRFGGEVMKNVAGYDASRLMCGALGTLGVLLDVSMKVLPLPPCYLTLVWDYPQFSDALAQLRQWQLRHPPLQASCWQNQRLYARFAGQESVTQALRQQLGGEVLQQEAQFWDNLRDQKSPFFQRPETLWRLSLDAEAPEWDEAESVYEWHGQLRWIYSDDPAIRDFAAAHGGHALQYRNPISGQARFHPLSAGLLTWHKNLKQAFDPAGILNHRLLYEAF